MKKANSIIEFCIFELDYLPKFSLKLTILRFWTKFAQEGYFRSKTEKVNTAIEFFIFQFSL